MKLLIHICCANCALYPINFLKQKGIDLTGFWYNPNIHPVTEYNARLDALKILQPELDLNIYYKDLYGLRDFIKNTAHNEQNRCLYCYKVRLEETALTAKKLGFNAFSTTLLYSIYQKYDTIIETGYKIENTYNIQFFVKDFRIGWHEGIEISKKLGLYRQKYCGCIYSELDRYAKKLTKRGCKY